MAGKPDVPDGDAVAAAADLANPELRDAATALTTAAMRAARDILEHGAPSIQQSVVKALVPSIAKQLADPGEDERYIQLRAELDALHEAMRVDTPEFLAAHGVQGVAVVDAPPDPAT